MSVISKLPDSLRKALPAKSQAAAGAKPGPEKHWAGIVSMMCALMILGLLGGFDEESKVKVFYEGEVATQDVTANQDLRLEDREATARRRDQVAVSQPAVFDLNPAVFESVRRHVQEILSHVRQSQEDPERLRWEISEELNTEISKETLAVWRQNDFAQTLDQVYPWLKTAYVEGVAASKAKLAGQPNGILIRDLSSGMESLRSNFDSIHDVESLKEGLDQQLKNELKRNLKTRKAVNTLVAPFFEPNLVFNPMLSQARKSEAVAAVDPIHHLIRRGEIIVRQGERVGPEQQRKLQAMRSQTSSRVQFVRALGIVGIEIMFLLGLHLAFIKKQGLWWLSTRDWLFLSTVLVLFALAAKGLATARHSLAEYPVLRQAGYPCLLLPAAGAAGVLALFFPKTTCFFMNLLLSFACAFIGGGGLPLFCFYFIGAMSYTFLIKRSETRAEVMNSIFPLAVIFCLLTTAVNMIEFKGLEALAVGLVMSLVNALLSLLCLLGLSPILENAFGYTSRFKLMELLNLEQPLLQRLMVEAPGTYHHSLIVSNMVEAGARAIGANALLAKAAALYHDIGKLKNPLYFIENQMGGINKHDKLTPTMSALILIAHAKKGQEMAREYKLGPEIGDLIRQHHGTTLIAYFYHKAQELAEAKGDEPISDSEFRYPGPKPQTKEAGLILIADAIEASSRTLVDPTPSRVRGHIDNIVRKVFTEGELDESELTLKDLTLISDTFHRILTGIFHHRIEYPGGPPKDADKAKDTKAAPVKELTPAKAAAGA